MVIIQNIDDNTFLFNNRKYKKNYLVLKLGLTNVAIHNAYDVRLQLLESTHFSQVQVDGNVHESQEALMSVLAPLLFNNGGASSGSTQNNRGVYIQCGIIEGTGDITPAQLSTFINTQDWSFIVAETTTPVLFEALRTDDGVTKKYIFIFLQGKGNWGAASGSNPNPVYSTFFKLISVQNLTPDDIEEDENSQINYLGEVGDGNFVNVANETEWAFTSTTEQYYFSYTTDDVLYFALFVGEPDVYGGGGMDTNDFSESDFVITTNSSVPPVAIPNLQQVLNEASTATIVTPLNISSSGITFNGQSHPIKMFGSYLTFGTSTAVGSGSVAIGTNNTNAGYVAVALGNGNNILSGGDYAMAVNSENTIGAAGDYSFVGGRSNYINGTYAVSFGSVNTVSATHGVAIGNGNTASGQWSTVFGQSNTAGSVYETVLGYNAVNLGGNSAVVQSADTVFRVGIGVNNAARADAFRIYKSGRITAPSTTISGITAGDAKTLITKEYFQAYSGSTVGGTWGSIAGTLTAQTDLITALSAKGNLTGGNTWVGNQTVQGKITASAATDSHEVVVLSQLDRYLYLDSGSPSLVKSCWYGTKAEYEALGSYDPHVEYNINSDEFKGSLSISANGTTTISIFHGLDTTPSWVSVGAKNTNAGGFQYFTTDSSKINITYSSPPTGMLEYWVAYNV